jgi:starch synthase
VPHTFKYSSQNRLHCCQGIFSGTALAEAALDPALFRPDGLEFFGSVSYIKGGISFAAAPNTASPTYAREIQTPGLGFGPGWRTASRAAVLSGILNGVDYREWSPEVDALIPARYSAADGLPAAIEASASAFPA